MPISWRAVARRVVPRRLRNWLRSPGTSLWWLRDRVLDAALGPVARDVRPGWRLRAPRSAWRAAYRAHMADSEQAAELDAFIGACGERMLLFDVGAHFGLFSFAALHYGGPLARAVAVDPSPLAVRMTRRVARWNDLSPRLDVVEAAAGPEEGRLALVDAGVQSVGYYVQADDDHPASERSEVAQVTVDGLARRLGTPTHLKIDVEGFEEEVLRGAEAVLRGPAPPVVFLELHHSMLRRRGGDAAAALDRLAALGYAVFDCAGREADRAALLSRDLVRVIARRGIS